MLIGSDLLYFYSDCAVISSLNL